MHLYGYISVVDKVTVTLGRENYLLGKVITGQDVFVFVCVYVFA